MADFIKIDNWNKVLKNLNRAQQPEVEIRFGTFNRDRWQAGVGLRVWSRVLTDFKNKFQNKITYDRSLIEIFGEVRFTNKEAPIQKNRIVLESIYDYGMRLALSDEVPLKIAYPNIQPTLVRDRQRWSVMLQNNYRLDLSSTSDSYEVEVEILDATKVQLPELNKILKGVYQVVYDTVFIYSLPERYAIIYEFNRLVDPATRETISSLVVDHRKLDQARNLKARDMVTGGLIPAGSGTPYGVSIKADGVKEYLFIHDRGIYLIHAPGSVRKIYPRGFPSQVANGTIFQGELIPESKLTETASDRIKSASVYLLLYDSLSVGGQSTRGEVFEKRKSYIAPYLDKLNAISPKLVFEEKIFHSFRTVSEFYQKVNSILDDTYPYLTDGLIFQPLKHPYDSSVQLVKLEDRQLSLYPDIVKWKPPHMLTLDLAINNLNGQTQLEVNIGHGHTETFVGSLNYPFDPTVNLDLNHPLIKQAFNGTILEFEWNKNMSKLVPLRVRDKPTPNNKDISLDVWYDIHNPITENSIRGKEFFLIDFYQQRQISYISKVNLDGPITILSFGGGSSSDFQRWSQIPNSHIYLVQPNEQQMLLAINRAQTYSLNITPIMANSYDTEVINPLIPNLSIDRIEYLLTLSPLFSSDDRIISILQWSYYKLKPGGILIALTLDGERVLDYFRNPDNRSTSMSDTEVTYQSRMKLINFQLYGPSNMTELPQLTGDIPPNPQLYLKVNGQRENLVNITRLTQSLNQYNIILYYHKSLNQGKFMTKDEITYASLLSSLMYKKAF